MPGFAAEGYGDTLAQQFSPGRGAGQQLEYGGAQALGKPHAQVAIEGSGRIGILKDWSEA